MFRSCIAWNETSFDAKRWRDLNGQINAWERERRSESLYTPWHFLYFFPLPQGQGSLRPTLSSLC